MASVQLDEQRLDAVDRLHRRRRVVHRRRQRADGDVDEHAQRERRILVHGPLAREHQHTPRERRVGLPLRAEQPQRGVGPDVLADRGHDLDERAGLVRQPEQHAPIDRGQHRRRAVVPDLAAGPPAAVAP